MCKLYNFYYLFLFALISFNSQLSAQSNQAINYQAVVRDSVGQPIDNSNFNVVVKINDGVEGNILYQETHNVFTNQFGLFTLGIGSGFDSIGLFSEINWGANDLWIEVEIDGEVISNTKFLSVPYAFHAQTVTNNDDADADSANEFNQVFLVDSVTSTISIEDAGGILSINLNPILNQFEDGDGDATNEYNQSFTVDTITNVITIADAGESLAIDLTSIINQIEDADADFTNELNQSFELNTFTNTISLTDEGGTFSVDLTPILDQLEDDDADPTNELINNFTLTGNTITINESGDNFVLDLTPLTIDNDWQVETGKIYNLNDKVGVGTSNPNSTFHVNGSQSAKVNYLPAGTTAYTMAADDYIVIASVASNNVALNLPLASNCPGRIYIIKKAGIQPQTFDISISPAALDFIEDSSSPLNLTSFLHESVTLVSTGAQGWYVISKQN
jgi:hypothetical protein